MSIFSKRIFGFAAVVFGILISATAVAHTDGIYNPTANSVGNFEGIDSNAATATAGCSQATAFLARNGNAHPTETTTLICGLVSDGDFSSLDVLYVFATDTSAHALLNLISTSFTAALNGAPTFTANTGFATAATDFIQTGFIASSAGGHYSTNSASIGYYNRTSSVAADSSVAMGAATGALYAAFIVQNQGGSKFYDVNDIDFPSVVDLQHQGLWIATRIAASGAGALAVYKNGNTTPLGTDTSGANNVPVPTVEFYILGSNSAGTVARSTTDQIAAAFIGGGLTSVAIGRISSRINAYMTTLGINVY